MVRVALCSPFLPQEIRSVVEKLSGVKTAPIPLCGYLSAPIAHHPDMLFFNPPKEEITILSNGYYAVNRRFFDGFGALKLCLDNAELSDKYPSDVAFDAVGIGDALYCLEAHTAEEVKGCFDRVVNVRQGYAACSTLVLNDRAAVTADKGIAAALKADGIEVLTVCEGGIALPGYNCGFIGGASAVINGKVIFFGSITSHPDGKEILAFCCEHGCEVVDFPQFSLTDYGSVRYLYI